MFLGGQQSIAKVVLLFLAVLMLWPSLVLSQDAAQDEFEESSSWSLSLDNDLLTTQDRDKDYTGGIALSITGSESPRFVYPLNYARSKIENVFGISQRLNQDGSFKRHSAGVGFVLFTPLDITDPNPNFNDRPYGSLFFAVSSEQTVLPKRKLSVQSSFTFGFLGLPFADDAQSGLHQLSGSVQPEGWENQISAGGEPTARYSLGAQKLVSKLQWSNNLSSEFKWTTEASVGFTTGINAGFNLRVGRLTSPWWSFNPHQAEYVNLGNRSTSKKRNYAREFFFYMGATTTLRAYNALLQGQFRDSVVRFRASELNPLIFEGWAGVSVDLNRNWAFSWFGRARTAELDKEVERSPTWAGFIIHRTF